MIGDHQLWPFRRALRGQRRDQVLRPRGEHPGPRAAAGLPPEAAGDLADAPATVLLEPPREEVALRLALALVGGAGGGRPDERPPVLDRDRVVLAQDLLDLCAAHLDGAHALRGQDDDPGGLLLDEGADQRHQEGGVLQRHLVAHGAPRGRLADPAVGEGHEERPAAAGPGRVEGIREAARELVQSRVEQPGAVVRPLRMRPLAQLVQPRAEHELPSARPVAAPEVGLRVDVERQHPLRVAQREQPVERRAKGRGHRRVHRSSDAWRGAGRCCMNHAAAISATASSAPGSSNRCVAPGTRRSSPTAPRRASARRLSSAT